jgi:hypothetical protein
MRRPGTHKRKAAVADHFQQAETASSPLVRPNVSRSTTRTLTACYGVITTLPVFCPVSTYR